MGFRSGGRRFQIGVAMVSDWWLWALDRVAVRFRLSFRLWDFGGRGVVGLCVAVGFARYGPSWV